MANIVDTDALNQYDKETGTFTSSDSSSPESWQSVAVLASGETKPSIFAKISKMFANIRWLNSSKRTTGAFDSKNDTVTFTTADVSSDSSATSWTTVSQLTSGLSHATLLNRISAMMKNVRYLNNVITYKYYSSSNYSEVFSNIFVGTSGVIDFLEIRKVGRICCINLTVHNGGSESMSSLPLGYLRSIFFPYGRDEDRNIHFDMLWSTEAYSPYASNPTTKYACCTIFSATGGLYVRSGPSGSNLSPNAIYSGTATWIV